MTKPAGYIEDHRVLDTRQFKIAVRRLADSLGYGTDRSPFVGSGIDYVQSRTYEPGDAVKTIDWRITARTGKPHVKQYETPRRVPVWLLVDTSASMTIGMGKTNKYETAVFLAGGIALSSLDRMSPVGVLGVGERRLRVPPTLARPQIMGWLHQLRRFEFGERTRLSAELSQLSAQLPERSLIFVLSDLHDADAVAMLKRVAARHETVVLQLRDPASRPMPGTGFLRAKEAETGRAFISHRHSAPDLMHEDLRRAGVDHLLIDVDVPYVGRLRQFLFSRGQLGRGGR
ncbi:DUF58 domain-containing protein [Planctomicrobium piriforme]|nr:DUF58 domain-containing protein [Planctomicrobium piriforme]